MGNNKLKLNPDKTEFIVIGDDLIRSSLKSSFPVSLLGNTMEPAESVKNLGVILDAENSMQRHVANLCRISYCHLQELRRVRRYLNHETAVNYKLCKKPQKWGWIRPPLRTQKMELANKMTCLQTLNHLSMQMNLWKWMYLVLLFLHSSVRVSSPIRTQI